MTTMRIVGGHATDLDTGRTWTRSDAGWLEDFPTDRPLGPTGTEYRKAWADFERAERADAWRRAAGLADPVTR